MKLNMTPKKYLLSAIMAVATGYLTVTLLSLGSKTPPPLLHAIATTQTAPQPPIPMPAALAGLPKTPPAQQPTAATPQQAQSKESSTPPMQKSTPIETKKQHNETAPADTGRDVFKDFYTTHAPAKGSKGSMTPIDRGVEQFAKFLQPPGLTASLPAVQAMRTEQANPRQVTIRNITGIICLNGSNCSASTDLGTVRPGDIIADEKITAITQTAITTNKRIIELH